MNRKENSISIRRSIPVSLYQGTLLDGELVQNKKTERYEFIVCDALFVDGKDVRMNTLQSRWNSAFHAVKNIEYREDQPYDICRYIP